jgi:hypothetical protein
MKTVPIAGAGSVSFFEDDTLDVVRQHIALAVNSYPPRMYIEAKVSLPETYYADPRHWEALFLRVSLNGVRVDKDLFKVYTEQVRGLATAIDPPASREEWMSRPAALELLHTPGAPFLEWRPFGIPDERCMTLPMPPKDMADLPATRIPVPNGQSLFETLYPESHDIAEFRALTVPVDASQLVQRVYFPLIQPDTPQRLSESEIQSLRTTTDQLKTLLELEAPQPNHVSVLRAKWFAPFVETEFSAPRARFEEMFYGLTVSKKTPYVGYFTSRQELTRHKFFVTDETTKTPYLDTGLWKSWAANTQPQRKLPTLLLYRGTGRTSFDRIAITNKDVTFTSWRTKESKESIEEIQAGFVSWFKTLDAVTPFVETRDVDTSRWELQDLSILASFPKEIAQFDMLRFPCLRSVFSSQGDSFRLMRAEHLSQDMTPQELRAYQVLYETEDSNANTLVTELGMEAAEADALVRKFVTLGEEIDLERILRGYPTFKYRSKEVIVSSVTNVTRILQYASMLRHVLTSDDAAVNAICPRRLQVVEAVSAPAAVVTVQEGNFEVDDDLAALLGLGEEPSAVEEPAPAAQPAAQPAAPVKQLKLESAEGTTYNYFNRRLRAFNAVMFNETYPSNCEKTKQVVVLTPEQEAKLPAEYSARNWTTLELNKPDGVAICPQYWCVVDELPLRADQLVDGTCPVCHGKIIKKKADRTPEFSLIERNQTNVYPAYKEGQPCCYKERRSTEVVSKDVTKDDTYILATINLPERRMAFLSDELARSLRIKTSYATSVPKNRIETGNADFFRIGLGRPSKTLPAFLKVTTPIPAPDKARDVLMQCSFFRTWTDLGEGETQQDRIASGITAAYAKGALSALDELEYVTAVIKCKVIRISTKTNTVSCGYWSDTLSAQSRTIVLLDGDILGHAQRRATKSKDNEKFDFKVDIQKEPFSKDTVATLSTLHSQACASNTPDLQAAFTELRVKGKANPQLILDPFGRAQAVFMPGVVVLPIQPVTQPPLPGVPVRSGYADIKTEELPTQADLRSFLDATQHPGFKWVEDLVDADGRPTESLLASGFRAPFKPGAPIQGKVAKEVVGTVRTTNEDQLVNGAPNEEDAKTFREVSYAAEVFDFLLFSLSKDIQNADFSPLRNSILRRDANLYKRLETWMTKKSYWEVAENPRDFVNKVRTPCGQFKQKDACNASSLCGYTSGACRIKVNESPDKKPAVLRRMVKTLMENDKQRALVLDERMSPFFSTVLYMEMPHELITTSV